MSDQPFVGQIKIFAFNFNPRGHALCNGQLLSIATNTALFSLLGTTYGGNGVNNFALPNLQSRIAIHFGQGPGLPNYTMGQLAGEENHTLIAGEMPQHNHFAVSTTNQSDQTYPPNTLWAVGGSSQGYTSSASGTMAPTALAQAGGNQPHNNMQPFLVVNYSIALVGIFPSRN